MSSWTCPRDSVANIWTFLHTANDSQNCVTVRKEPIGVVAQIIPWKSVWLNLFVPPYMGKVLTYRHACLSQLPHPHAGESARD